MTTETKRVASVAAGANNLAEDGRVPDGFVRRMVNFDPRAGGSATLRVGYEQAVPGTNVRAGAATSTHVVFVDGGDVRSYHRRSASVATVGSVDPGSPVAATTFNDEVYLSTTKDSIRVKNGVVKPWTIAEPGYGVEVIAGSLTPGIYKVAAVAVGDDGEESGTEPFIVRVSAGQALRVTSDDSRPLRVYCSVNDGATLFYQGVMVAGAMALQLVDDHTETLETGSLAAFPSCQMLAAHRGVILGAIDNVVYFTSPLCPHLHDPMRNFVQFPANVSLLASTEGGVFVVADQTYFLTGIEGENPQQRRVSEVGAVAGSAVILPDKRAAWFTEYGLAIGSADGSVEYPNRDSYAPNVAERGASGVLAYNGSRMVVTTSRGTVSQNNISAGDYADLETGDER